MPTKAEWEATIAGAVALGCTALGAPSLTNDPGFACLVVGPTSFAGVALPFVYWSSSALEDNPSAAWLVFLEAGTLEVESKLGSLSVWPVRGGQ